MATSNIAIPGLDIASAPGLTRPTFLMCPPQWYGVDYVINPWMAGNLHRSSRDSAFTQWKSLYNALRAVADVRLLHPEEGAPDMVFLAHGAVVRGGVAALASFSHGERRSETAHLRRWLAEHGFLLWDTPRETAFEAGGDMVFNAAGTELWAAHGTRTCRSSHRHVAEAWNVPVHSLHLIDPRFFHLDTCFAPLNDGSLLYFPGAFDAASLAKIETAFSADRRIPVTEPDAIRLACSALNVGRHIFLSEVSQELSTALVARGFEVHQLQLEEFLKSGGGAKSLALMLNEAPKLQAAAA